MGVLLLAVIYLSYISIGLPDSLLGAAWPSMQPVLGVPLSHAGYLSLIISCGTVLASLLSDRLICRFGTGAVVAGSVLLTAAALYGYSAAGSFSAMCLYAVPYGLGAGAVDAALNHYVAVHYAARHMNWLHCFWGIGAAASPYIMSFCLRCGGGWQGGYRSVSIIQFVLTAMLFCSLPLWNHVSVSGDASEAPAVHIPIPELMKQHGVSQLVLLFFCYCALENTFGLWAGSYLVHVRGTMPETAAQSASLFFLGITFGRLAGGFLSDRISCIRMVRGGLCGIALGIFLLLLPASHWAAFCGIFITGLGCAPVHPALIRGTATRFGAERARSVIGLQTASAYLGTTIMPFLFGKLADFAGIRFLPVFLLLFLFLTAFLTKREFFA